VFNKWIFCWFQKWKWMLLFRYHNKLRTFFFFFTKVSSFSIRPLYENEMVVYESIYSCSIFILLCLVLMGKDDIYKAIPFLKEVIYTRTGISKYTHSQKKKSVEQVISQIYGFYPTLQIKLKNILNTLLIYINK
jgi:hypothetical protein